MQQSPNIKRIVITLFCLFSTLFFYQCGGKPKNAGSEKETIPTSKSLILPNDSSQPPAGSKAKVGTRQIDTITANNAINAYLQHENKLMIKTSANPAGETLRGFVIKMSNIQNLLSKNPDQLFLEFAVFPDSLNSPASNQHFTLVISGYKNGKIIRENSTDLLYEYLRPCPPNGDCP